MRDEPKSGGHRIADTGEKCARCPGRMVISHTDLLFFSSYCIECDRCGWLPGESPKSYRKRRILNITLTLGIGLGICAVMVEYVLPNLLHELGV